MSNNQNRPGIFERKRISMVKQIGGYIAVNGAYLSQRVYFIAFNTKIIYVMCRKIFK